MNKNDMVYLPYLPPTPLGRGNVLTHVALSISLVAG